jgi:protein-disulfide isomerase
MSRRRIAVVALLALAACGGEREPERNAPSWGALAGETPIARLDGETILLDDVGPELGLQVYQHQLDVYALLKRETERIVGERLLAREAERQKLSVDALVQRELDASGGTPTDAEVTRYLEEHPDAARWPEARARVASYLAETRRLERRTALVARLRDQAKLEFLVEPPVEPRVRLDLTDVPVRGPENARVTLVHFASFGSPLSAHSAAQLARLATEFPERLRFAHRTFLGEPDEMALAAAELAVAAQQAGKFWEAHDRLFAQEGEITSDVLDKIASDLGIERKAVGTDGATRARLRRDQDAGMRAGVKQEPAVFANGRYLSGSMPYEELRRAVTEELGGGAARP